MMRCKMRKPLPILSVFLLLAALCGPALAGASAPGAETTTAPVDAGTGAGTWAAVAAAISGGLWAVWALVRRFIAQNFGALITALLTRLEFRVSQDQQAALESFAELQIRAVEERFLAGRIDAAGEKGAAKLRAVTDAVRERFPSLKAEHVDRTIHAVLHRVEGLGASGPKPAAPKAA